ncbi:MAG: HPr(Ser) kinase/phosphatase [Burkholderiaceae bacterium]
MSLTVNDLLAACRESLTLSWISPEGVGGEREAAEVGGEPANLVGHLNLIHRQRTHVLGAAELDYCEALDPRRRRTLFTDLLDGEPPALIIAEGLGCPSWLHEFCSVGSVPIIGARESAAGVIDRMRSVLYRAMASKLSMHGVLMDVLGMGVLIAGESGLGKSELALELISRGHGLVADDVVEFSRIAENVIEGRCPPLLQNLLEVRGLGLLDIRTIFGETAVRRRMRLKLIVQLARANPTFEAERLPLQTLTQTVLGLPIRKMIIPVAAGRNLAVLTEGAVRTTVMQLRGIDTTAEFIAKQRKLMMEEDDGS